MPKKKIVLILVPIVALGLLLFSAAVFAAYPINEILSPVTGQAVFAPPSGTFDIELLGLDTRALSVNLMDPDGNSQSLEWTPASSEGCDCVRIQARVPSDTAPGLKDLKIEFERQGKSGADTQLRAVSIVPGHITEITVLHITDFHVGDPRSILSTSGTGMNADEIRARVLDALGSEAGDLVLLTGDIASVPGNYPVEYTTAYKELLEMTTHPLLCVPGNHDLYAITPGAQGPGDGLYVWGRYFGRTFGARDLGPFHIVFMDSYDWPARERDFSKMRAMKDAGSYAQGAVSNDQLRWLRADTKAAVERGQKIIIAAHHAPVDIIFRDQNGIEAIASRDEFLDWIKSFPVEIYIAGHNHANTDSVWEGVRVITTTTASSHLGGEDGWGYRSIRFSLDNPPQIKYVEVVPAHKP